MKRDRFNKVYDQFHFILSHISQLIAHSVVKIPQKSYLTFYLTFLLTFISFKIMLMVQCLVTGCNFSGRERSHRYTHVYLKIQVLTQQF